MARSAFLHPAQERSEVAVDAPLHLLIRRLNGAAERQGDLMVFLPDRVADPAVRDNDAADGVEDPVARRDVAGVGLRLLKGLLKALRMVKALSVEVAEPPRDITVAAAQASVSFTPSEDWFPSPVSTESICPESSKESSSICLFVASSSLFIVIRRFRPSLLFCPSRYPTAFVRFPSVFIRIF